jgi:hypothetical protein
MLRVGESMLAKPAPKLVVTSVAKNATLERAFQIRIYSKLSVIFFAGVNRFWWDF